MTICMVSDDLIPSDIASAYGKPSAGGALPFCAIAHNQIAGDGAMAALNAASGGVGAAGAVIYDSVIA